MWGRRVVFAVLLAVCVCQHEQFLGKNPPLPAGSFVKTIYTTTLSSSQVVPKSVFVDGWGTAFCELNRQAATLHCNVCHNLQAPSAAYLSVAPRLQLGPVIAKFSVQIDKRQYFEELFQLEEFESYPLYQQIDDFLNGHWYLTVEDKENSAIIRGQLEQANNLMALLANENTFPQAFGPSSRGIVVATYVKNNPLRRANFDVCHDVVDATFTVIGRGVPGFPGKSVYNFRQVEMPIFGEFDYSESEEHELFTGYQYAQVFSKLNPQGAARGQLTRVDPVPTVTVTSRMDGNQLGADDRVSRGCVLVSYDCKTRLMEFLVFHSVPQAVRLEARAAPPGFSGPVLFSRNGLDECRSPIFSSQVLSLDEDWILFAEQMYFELHSVNYPNGEIRGQLTTQFDFFSIMTGNQHVPPVTTSNLGCATFDLSDLNYKVDFEILHSIKSVTAVEWFRGPPGDPGELQTKRNLASFNIYKSPRSPLLGSWIIDDDEQSDWVNGNTFVQISSKDYPDGEIRGQIVRIKPCDSIKGYDTQSFEVADSLNSLIELPIRGSSSMLEVSLILMFGCFLIFLFELH